MTGGGNMAAFGALLMVTTVRPDPVPMIFWFGAIAALGVFTAIPIKRQLINQEGLAFPTGKATAETLRAIHGAADGAGRSGRGGEGIRRPARSAVARCSPPRSPGCATPRRRGCRSTSRRRSICRSRSAAGRPPTGRSPSRRSGAVRRRRADELPHRLVAAAGRAAHLRVPRPRALLQGHHHGGQLQGDRRLDGVARRRDSRRLGPDVVRARLEERGALVRGHRPHLHAPACRRGRGSDGRDRVPRLVVPGGLRRAGTGRGGAHDLAVPDPVVGGPGRGAARGGDGLRGRARDRRDRRDSDQGARPRDAVDLRRHHARKSLRQHHERERHGRHRAPRRGPADHAQDRLAARRQSARSVLCAALRRARRRRGRRARVQPADSRSHRARQRRVARALVHGVGRRVEGVRGRARSAGRRGARRHRRRHCCSASRSR